MSFLRSISACLLLPLLSLGAFAANAASITPSSLNVELVRNQTVTVERTVTLDASGPAANRVDVVFLADNTGSMGGVINTIRTNAQQILNAISGGDPRFVGIDVQFGVASYNGDPREFGGTPQARALNAYRLYQAITPSRDAVNTALAQWRASGGGDGPEANFFALHQVATSGGVTDGIGSTDPGLSTGYATGWRPGAARVVVWFGDVSSHTTTVDINEAIAALRDNNVVVAAINSAGANAGIDSGRQASNIVAAVGGSLTNNVQGTQTTVNAILNAVENATSAVDISLAVRGDTSGLDIAFSCASPEGCTGVSPGESRRFNMQIQGLQLGDFQFETYVPELSGAVASDVVRVRECVSDINAYAKRDKVELIWADAGADHYAVYRSDRNNLNYQRVGTTTSRYSVYVDRGLAVGVTYFYQVRELDAAGNELCSSVEVSATTSARSRADTTPVNRAPVITSTAPSSAQEDSQYAYNVLASDPNGDAVTYALIQSPAGMTLSGNRIEWTPQNHQVGDSTVIVRAQDGAGLFDDQVFTVTVVNTNDAPEILSSAPTTARAEQLYQYGVNAVDVDAGDSLTFSLVVAPAGMQIDSASGVISWTPAFMQQGSQDVLVRVSDSAGENADQAFSIVVEALNNPPAFTSSPLTSIAAGADYSYQLTVNDPNPGDVQHFSLLAGPAGMELNENTGLLTWPAAQAGVHAVSVQVADYAGLTDTQTFDLTVIAPNSAPVISSSPLTSAIENVQYRYVVTASDADGDALTFSLVAAPAGMAIDPASGEILWTPVFAQAGDQAVTVQVNDGELDAQQSFVITVTPRVNVAPIIQSVPVVSVVTGRAYHYQLLANDGDGDPLTFTLVQAAPGMTLSGTGLLEWTAGAVGEYSVEIAVSDDRGASAQQSFTLAVTEPPNNAPVISSTPSTSVMAGQAYSYVVAASDADGDTLQYALQQAPAGMVLNGTSLQWTPSVSQVGSHPVQLRVTDGRGGEAMQNFSIAVTELPNQAPVISSTPTTSITAGGLFQYQVQGNDADGDALQFSLTRGPSGASMNTGGLLSWQTADANVGNHPITVRLTDSRGAYAEQSFTLTVVEVVNNPPVISSTPVTQAQVGQPYAYTVVADDPENDPLTLTLVQAPAGMTMTAFGDISWTPVEAHVGSHSVQVRVSDGRQAVTQGFSVVVAEELVDADPLDVAISITPQIVAPGESVTIQITAFGGNGVPTVQATLDGGAIALVNGTALVPGLTTGTHTLQVRVSDSRENFVETRYFSVSNPDDSDAPVAQISTTNLANAITAPVNIAGTATDSNLAEYRLLYSQAGKNAWLEFARETTPVNNGTLAQLDPTVLENGTYDLLLLVRDVNGRQAQASASFSVDGDFKVGEFSFSIRDLGVPMLGLPIEVNRSYDTRRRNQSLDFGYGWSVDYQSMVVGENQRLGLNWAVTSSGSGFFRTYCVVPVGPHYVTVTRPDGRIDKFNARAVNNCSSLIPPTYVDLVFEAAPGTQSTLTADLSQQLRVNGTQLLNNDLIDVYDPDNYTLTTKEGLQFRLSQSAGIQWVADRAGNRITFSRNGIAHSAGKSIVFSRDGQGRITRITDPDGNAIRYEYDGAGNLARVIDREGNLVRHTYNRNHGLVDIIDPLGRRISRNIYDDAGRLIAIEDADGNRTAIDAEVASRTKRITDPLGNVRTIEYDVAGNPVREVDENGNQTLRTFNALGYLLSETDAAGNTRSYTYDSRGNRTSETDELGNVTSRTFDDFGNVLTVTNALGQTTTYAYDLTGKRIGEINAAGVGSIGTSDSSGNLLSITDSLGNTTSYVRDAYGQATAETDANGTRIDYAFDANGNQTLERVTVPDGSGVPRELRIERAFDANGNVILVRDAAGNEKRFAYDGSGNLASETDANGFTTAYEYDVYGRLSRTLFADGTSESKAYDAAGRVVSETDRLGRVTTHAYNAVGNRIRTEYPDGSSIASTYDAVGRVLTRTDERGNVTTYEYDAKGRRTAIVNALGQRRTFAYDAADNVILETDALGRQTTYAYDAGNRQVLVTFPDGVQISKTWDQMNRPLSQTNGNGHVTQYEYDAYGRLTSVTNPLGDTTRFEYLNTGKFGTRSYSDEVGAKTAQVDALGRRTQWQVDALGRPIAQVRPDGSADATTYDGKGNVATYRDYLGNTTRYEYNAFDQLTRQTLADGSSIRFAYAGKMLAQVDDQHGTTRYRYDLRDRLVRVDFADGRYVQYEYDATGNRTAVETATGLVNYSYDALNRLVEVDDPDSGVTRYEYNAAGELIATRFANGNSELREYNPRGELTAVRLVDRNNAELAVSRYTLDGAGNRLAEIGLESRENYAYDANGQLLWVESVTSGGTAVVEYAYDAVGNRVAVTELGSTLTSVYNNLDQLVTDGSGTYRYDANGNLIEVGGGAGTATLDYDLRGRLVRYQEGLVSEEYEYDHAGRRIAKISGGVEERYLLDVQVENAQVVEAQTGAQTKRYVYGLARIAEAADGQVHYFHHDGLGSTRSLTSEDGALTDVYQYSAFGELRSHTGTSANEFLFAGEQRDADSGLYYLRARYYSPETGRFTQVDPFQGVDENPLTLHDYEYAGNNPILLTDPSGRIWDIFLRGAQISRYTSIVARINFLLRTTTRGSVTTLRALKRSGQGIWRDASRNDEVHHIIEKRLLRQLGFRNVDDTPGIVLPREVHQIYTQRWMQALPRRGQTGHLNRLTTDDVINAAYKVYHDSPVQLRELLLFLL